MNRAWSTDAVYGAEAALMATLPDGELMARAVEGLALVPAARLQECDGAAVAALVGPGNNGADALYAVARLAEAGWNAVALHDEVVHEGARAAAEEAGVLLTTDPAALAEADVVLDGILGIGARPGLPPWAAAWVAAVPDTAYVIAVDLPSGQDPMGGALDPDGVFADETVTFSVPKPVHLLPPTEQACGILTVVDIGLELAADPVVLRLDHDDVAALWPVPTPADDKYSRGVVGVVAGGEAYTGAAVLAVTAALGAGAGMVPFVGSPTPGGLCDAGIHTLALYDRDDATRQRLENRLATHFPNVHLTTLPASLAEFDLLVNGSPAGMAGFDSLPLTPDLLATLTTKTHVADVVTAPVITPLLAFARERGCRTQTGPEMALAQMHLMGEFIGALPQPQEATA